MARRLTADDPELRTLKRIAALMNALTQPVQFRVANYIYERWASVLPASPRADRPAQTEAPNGKQVDAG